MLDELTLKLLARRAEIRIGYQRHTPPFSSAASGAFEPVGYSVDLAQAVVHRLSEACGGPLAIVAVETTSTTRESMLLAGEFDMECGSTTITAQRRQRAAFSQPIFRTSHRVALRGSAAANPGRTLRITGIEGSTSQAALLQEPPTGWHFEFHGQPSIGQAFHAYRFDPSIDGLVADEVILGSLLSGAGESATIMLDQRLGQEAYGFMLRKVDRELLSAVDDALGHVLSSAAFRQQLVRWLPPSALGLDARSGSAPAGQAAQAAGGAQSNMA